MLHQPPTKASERQRQQREDRSSPEASHEAGPVSPYAPILAMQRSAGNQAVHQLLQGQVPAGVQSVLNNGSGQPLAPTTRAEMESRFRQDFSQVRVHTDARAADSAEAVRAKAYTVGHDVVLGGGRYAPETSEGKRLLAHELAHVV